MKEINKKKENPIHLKRKRKNINHKDKRILKKVIKRLLMI